MPKCKKLKMVGYTSMAKCKALTGLAMKWLKDVILLCVILWIFWEGRGNYEQLWFFCLTVPMNHTQIDPTLLWNIVMLCMWCDLQHCVVALKYFILLWHQLKCSKHLGYCDQGRDLQNILRHTYDYLTIMPKLRSTDDERLIYKISYDYRMINLR